MVKIIGLTGGIGSGKTSVASKLKALGAKVFDADEAAKNAVMPGTEGFHKIVKTFGPKIVDAEGKLNRSALADIVFNDKESLRKLEEIVHGFVWQEADNFLGEPGIPSRSIQRTRAVRLRVGRRVIQEHQIEI